MQWNKNKCYYFVYCKGCIEWIIMLMGWRITRQKSDRSFPLEYSSNTAKSKWDSLSHHHERKQYQWNISSIESNGISHANCLTKEMRNWKFDGSKNYKVKWTPIQMIFITCTIYDQYNLIQCNLIQYNLIQRNFIQYNFIQCNFTHCNFIHCN